MTSRLKSLRQGTWKGDAANPRDVGESFRDIYSWLSKVRIPDVVEVNGAVWTESFSIAVALRPKIVSLQDARLAGTLTGVDFSGGGQWTLTANDRVTFTRIQGLTPGTSYDLKFLVVY